MLFKKEEYNLNVKRLLIESEKQLLLNGEPVNREIIH